MNPDGSLKESGSRMVGAGDTLYMSDQLGLHKVRGRDSFLSDNFGSKSAYRLLVPEKLN
jgi:hypothetical protein